MKKAGSEHRVALKPFLPVGAGRFYGSLRRKSSKHVQGAAPHSQQNEVQCVSTKVHHQDIKHQTMAAV
jgi:hypothetical protein